VAGAHQSGAGILAGAHRVTGGLLGRIRHANGGQLTEAQQQRQVQGAAASVFHTKNR